MSDAQWRRQMDIILMACFWCNRAFGRLMLAAGKGAIVNIGSMSGLISNNPQEQSGYNASKAAVHHLTKSLAGEWAKRGVRVNAVAPTYIETPLVAKVMESDSAMVGLWLENTPMGRLGQPHEIASAVHFLASDAASLMTGFHHGRRWRLHHLVKRAHGLRRRAGWGRLASSSRGVTVASCKGGPCGSGSEKVSLWH